jgi:peptidoglycan/xylan/chitin deacetylase (PgdA/CDA1 family)
MPLKTHIKLWALAIAMSWTALVLAAPEQGQAAPHPCATGAIETRTLAAGGNVSILAYHRFGLVVSDSMTVRLSTFNWQLAYLHEHRYRVVSLRSVVAYLRGEGPAPPPCSVVITVDDGHESVFTHMLPRIRQSQVPVTLFVYPSAISNASYAMTWHQLEALRDSELVDIQSHTYWHPNFTTEKRRLSPSAYREFATTQLCKSKDVLRDKLGVTSNLVAWPFGIHDKELASIARSCGYEAGVTLEARLLRPTDHLMALPRFLVTDTAVGRRFEGMLPQLGLAAPKPPN